jgi:hypothetical protein
MRVRHPYALEDDAPSVDSHVHIGGRRDTHPVDDEGVVMVDDDVSRSAVASWAKGYGYDLSELLVDEDNDDDDELCGTEKADGTVCERLVDECPYHS